MIRLQPQASGRAVTSRGLGGWPGLLDAVDQCIRGASDEATLAEYRELGIGRAVLAIPDLTRDEIMRVLDDYARLAARVGDRDSRVIAYGPSVIATSLPQASALAALMISGRGLRLHPKRLSALGSLRRCQGKVESSSSQQSRKFRFWAATREGRGSLSVPAKRRRALVATNLIEE